MGPTTVVDSAGQVPALLAQDLADVVAAALGRATGPLASVRVASITPPGSNMTTGGLWRVTGEVQAAPSPVKGNKAPVQEFSVIAKLTQSPLLWAGITAVPPEFREQLQARYPWRTEAQTYASGLAAALPAVVRMPQLYRISTIDDQRTVIWMADVPDRGGQWDDDRYAAAAYALGQLSGSAAVTGCVTEVAEATDMRRIAFFLDGVADQHLIPLIKGEDIWHHPAVAAAVDTELVTGLRRLTDAARIILADLAELPQVPLHGDASPQNMVGLARTADGTRAAFTMLDWGTFGLGPVGFDLGQLLAGRVNSGDIGGAQLRWLAPICLAAYCEGMADGGAEPSAAQAQRGMVGALAIFSSMFAVPLDQLQGPPSPGLNRLVAGRMDMVRFILEQVRAEGWLS